MNRLPARLAPVLAMSIVALCGLRPAAGAAAPRLLVVSQPRAQERDFVDLARNLDPALRAGGKYQVHVFKPDSDEVRAAVGAKRLTAADVKAPVSREAARRVAAALGYDCVLYVTSHYTDRGLDTLAYLDSRAAGAAWNTLVTSRLQPPATGRRSSLAEGVHGHVEALVQQVQGAASGIAATAPPPSDAQPPADEPPGAVRPADPVTAPAETAPVAPVGAGQDPPFSSYEAQITRARRSGDTTALVVVLRKAINERPRDMGLRRELIETYRAKGWTEIARDEVARAALLAPEDPVILRLVGDDLLLQGDTVGALKQFERAAQAAPGDVETLVALSDAYWNVARPDDARKSLEAAAQANPGSPLPHRKLARLHVLRGDYQGALAEFKEAARLTPEGDLTGVTECAGMLQQVEVRLSDTLARIQAVRKGLTDGTRTRETAFTEVTAVRKDADDTAQFIEALPAGSLARVSALYGQGATLLVQSAECYLLSLETRDSARDEEASLLRVEAGKQIAEAGRRLRATVGALTAGR